MVATSPTEIKTTKCALLVGTAHYDDAEEFPKLHTPAADVHAMARVLQRPECGFSVTTLIDPERTSFASKVEKMLASAGREDTFLFYFSGHGKTSSAGLLLCAKDTSGTALRTTSVRVSDIKESISTTKAKLVILIFDCCYSGEAFGIYKGSDISTNIWDELGRPEGKYLMTSSSKTQQSIELHEDQNSLFTKWLVNGLETWNADHDKDGIIYLKDLFDYAKKNVEDQNCEQTPQYKGFDTPGLPVEIAHRWDATAEPAAAATTPIPFLKAVRVAADNNQAIFFLGDGIYRDGPLSSPQLIQAIGKETGLDVSGQTCLPTATEQYQRLLDDHRPSFIKCFRGILCEEEKRAKTLPAIYEMLARVEPPWLVVSTTHDLLLERHLQRQGKPFTIVTHILRGLLSGEEAAPNGKILVMRGGAQLTSEITTADTLPDLDHDRVIYKLLGSPCFGDLQTASSQINVSALDTVVATEDDHATFVGLLRNEKTQIPTAFSLPFHRKSVVFLGYKLDTWHYRLVATVFRERMPRSESRQPHTYAVRQAKSPVEDLFWEKLHARMIEIDPDTFIHGLQTAQTASLEA
jgi:hypothetical protein